MDGPIAYTVTASFPDRITRDRYVRWLMEGHLEQVVAGGASEGMVVAHEEPESPLRVESRYIFPNREVFDRYVSQHAPKLRSEGLRLFGPELGVSFQRQVGVVLKRA
jgi:hypothetical protein